LKFPVKISGKPFLSSRFLTISLIIVAIFILGFPYPFFKNLGKFLLFLLIMALLVELYLLYVAKYELKVQRNLKSKLSNGDSNPITYRLKGAFSFIPKVKLMDDFPVQLQLRNVVLNLNPKQKIFQEVLTFQITPKMRGAYHFGSLRLLISSPLGLMEKLIVRQASFTVKVYPSIDQYKHFSFLAINNRLEEAGVKKMRRRGDSSEFDQIKEFTNGDDFKRINWKATARRDQIMVNHFEDEKAQHVYFLIDKGRSMHMPFNGLSLMDYAINSTLSMSGVAHSKGDKVGLITFSDVIGSWLPAKASTAQINLINEALYKQESRKKETDYFRLYRNIYSRIKHRSMLILFANFDSKVSLNRQLKYLQFIAKSHLLVVALFENQKIVNLAHSKATEYNEYFDQSIAEKFVMEKQMIINELKQAGIHTLLSSPQSLTVNSINKYLELKSRTLL